MMTEQINNSPRRTVLELLRKMENAKQFSNIALDKALERSNMTEADKRLASALFYGVIERSITLDAHISALSSRPIDQIDRPTLAAIRIGLYQLIYMDKIPPHAAINESVSLCPSKTKGFANAVLREYMRRPEISIPSIEAAPAEHLSLKHSVGLPLCRRFVDIFGAKRTDSIFSASIADRGTTLRVNTLKTTKEKLCDAIDGATLDSICPTALRMRGSVRNAYGYEEGLFFVQDVASQLCTAALDATEGETIIDVCSCPGSKSFGAAIDMNNKGEILAFDLHAKKLPLIESGAKRLGIDIIKVAQCDGRTPIPSLFGTADRVICDVPCSGFGVISKKPELRYKDPSESDALPNIQLAILENSCQYVKQGGILLYSTCTLFPSENENNVRRFLDKHQDFELSPFSVCGIDAPEGYVTLYPDIHGTDGFFIAKLKRS